MDNFIEKLQVRTSLKSLLRVIISIVSLEGVLFLLGSYSVEDSLTLNTVVGQLSLESIEDVSEIVLELSLPVIVGIILGCFSP